MSQIEIASLFVSAFALFMGGYWLGWRHRGQQPTVRYNGTFIETDGPLDAKTIARLRAGAVKFGFRSDRDLEAQVRRSQR